MTQDLRNWTDYLLTVGQLRARLEGLPDDMPVILEKDAEGNGYSPLSSADTEYLYEPESTWSGDVYPLEPEDEDSYHPGEHGTPVLLLGPVN